jgi:quercetin dioxygenase-like cupin family protein
MLDWSGDGETKGMQSSHVRNPQEGKHVTTGTMQLTLKASGAETGGRFALVEVTVPPYFAGIWPHLHQRTTEAIYLTQGLFAVTLGEETMVVRQGSFILIQPHQVHRFWNPTANPTTFLAFYMPAGAEEFFEAALGMEFVEEKWLPGDLAELLEIGQKYDHFPVPSSIAPEPS